MLKGQFRPLDVKDILLPLQDLVLRMGQGSRVNALRGEELECAARAFNRSSFDPYLKLDVVFVDGDGVAEGAVDEGGPTREFCTLLIHQIQNHFVFEGPEGNKTLALNSVALQKGQYRLVGNMIALCLVQGQVSPRFLSERLYRQIADATHVEGAREAMEEATDELSLMGSFSFVRSLPHRDELLGAALNFLTEGRIQGWTGHLAYRASSRISRPTPPLNNGKMSEKKLHIFIASHGMGRELKMENRKKRPGGAEKMRLKKLKSLEVEAAKCSKLTDLFGAGVTTPACAAAPEDERVEAYM
ncbi:unnamed protein product, partial [Boreogadus saida]